MNDKIFLSYKSLLLPVAREPNSPRTTGSIIHLLKFITKVSSYRWSRSFPIGPNPLSWSATQQWVFIFSNFRHLNVRHLDWLSFITLPLDTYDRMTCTFFWTALIWESVFLSGWNEFSCMLHYKNVYILCFLCMYIYRYLKCKGNQMKPIPCSLCKKF